MWFIRLIAWAWRPALFGIDDALFGSLAGGVLSFLGNERTNDSNQAMAGNQMAFQERMSSTAYQRAVKDMQDAGLNPMLAYSQGGASSPGGASATLTNSVGAGVASAQSAAATISAAESVKVQKAQREKIEAEAAEIKSRTYETSLNAAIRREELARLRTDIHQGTERGTLLGHQATLARYDADHARDTFSARVARTRAEATASELDLGRKELTFEDDVAIRKLQRTLMDLGIPAAKAESKFWESAEDLPQSVKLLLQILQGISGSTRSIKYGH